MRKTKNSIYLGTFSLATIFTIGSVFAPAINQNVSKTVKLEKQSSNLAPSDFETKALKNNLIFNEGSPNYQYQSLISSQDVNDPNTYNRNSVLSNKSIQTVRNKDFYFNFIQAQGAATFHIMVTPVNPYSNILPIKIETEYTHMNGSILWMKDRLVIIGSKGSNVLLSAYSQDLKTGNLKLEHSLEATASRFPELFSLNNVETKLIDSWPFRPVVNQMYSYNTYSKPMYLSPIEDLSNSSDSKFSLLAWQSSHLVGELQPGGITPPGGATAINSPNPVQISYDLATGFSIGDSFELDASKLTDDPNNPTVKLPKNPNVEGTSPETYSRYFTVQEYLSTRILGLTPLIDADGNFSVYMHSFGGVQDRIGYVFFTRLSVVNSKIVIEYVVNGDSYTEPAPENPNYGVVDIESNTGDFSRDNSLRDPMNYLPYGIFANGDAENPNSDSPTINLFFFITNDAVFNSQGVGTNLVIEKGKEVTAPPEMQVVFFQYMGMIYGNYFIVEQIYYPPERNLSDGINISVRYRGVGSNNFVTRLGTINWRQPWNPALWSFEAAVYGTTIVDGYGASPASSTNYTTSTKNIYLVDVMSTVWNGIYSATGIYQGQDRLTDPQTGALPTLPAVRAGVKNLIKNLNITSTRTSFNTAIPFNISLNPTLFPNLSPTVLGSEEILQIVEQRSIDYPNNFELFQINNLEFIQAEEDLILDGVLYNPYIDGIQYTDGLTLPFNLRIQHIPTSEAIANPIKINNQNNEGGFPSSILTSLNEAFPKIGVFNETAGVIGRTNKNLVQVLPSMAPFVSQFEATADDFLGELKIKYEITPTNSSQSTIYQISVSGFWGNVWLIPIVIGSVLLIGFIVLLIFLLLKRKHKKDLSLSISKGFNLYKLNQSKPKKNNLKSNNSFPSKPLNKGPSFQPQSKAGPANFPNNSKKRV